MKYLPFECRKVSGVTVWSTCLVWGIKANKIQLQLFLLVIYFFCSFCLLFLMLSPLLLCPSVSVWLWTVYFVCEIGGDICECCTETVLWKYTDCVYVHSSMTVFVCSLLVFVLFKCSKTLRIWLDFQIFRRKMIISYL